MSICPFRTKSSGLYRHREDLGLHKVGYKGKESTYSVAKLAFHAKESTIRTRERVFSLVSSQPISPAHVQQAGRPRTP